MNKMTLLIANGPHSANQMRMCVALSLPNASLWQDIYERALQIKGHPVEVVTCLRKIELTCVP